jgi:hypothetical protein
MIKARLRVIIIAWSIANSQEEKVAVMIVLHQVTVMQQHTGRWVWMGSNKRIGCRICFLSEVSTTM